MPGPTKPFLSPEGARGGQYVTVPAFASPGHSSPSNTRDAPGSTIVYSPKGWRWEEAGDDYSKTVSKLTAATMESTVRRIKTSMGEVLYIRGTADTRPPFNGASVGDTCRVQDAQTLDIVAEWKWDGATWERMRVTSEQISNLDVGKLTAGAANIAEITARKIASDVGRFLEITTDQLTVTGNASFVNATAHHVWTEIITAGQGEFEQIKAGMLAANSVNASNIQGGAIDGQVITGATIQTDTVSNRGLKISNYGMRVYASNGWKALDVNAQTGEISINGRLGRRDSWSEVWFNDILSRDSGTDTYNGERYGCGLSFNSIVDDWYDGTISLRRASTGDPALRIQGPAPKKAGTSSPYLTVGTSAIAMYTPKANASFSFNSLGLNLQAQSVYWWMNDTGFSYGVKNDNLPRLYVGKNEAQIRTLGESQARFWADKNTTAIQFTQSNQVWIANSGVHITGTKNFSMRVPVLTARRGGLWLKHACTESPYDGIEYWESIELDSAGHARWVLPDYVPRIASSKAPWVAFASDGARASLDRSDAEEWAVDVTGTPGATVAVLVKGARMIDVDVDEVGEPVMRDYARESRWHLGPPSPEPSPGGGGDLYPGDMSIGGGLYGPAPRPEDWRNDNGSTDQPG
jgi:hypothetical protein